jgi:xylulokinase
LFASLDINFVTQGKHVKMYAIGYDIGSSSVKASIVRIDNGKIVAHGKYPDSEMPIKAEKTGWAEQDPEMWWKNVCTLTRSLLEKYSIHSSDIQSIGISYQMHGLVLVDKNQQVLRPSIIWCDSRAGSYGEQAHIDLGAEYTLGHLLNSPGNFTASKLKWVLENEPALFDRIDKWMLPGDFIAMKFTNEICSTMSGYSEGILWDFKSNKPAIKLMEYFGIPDQIMPPMTDTFSVQGKVTVQAAQESGLAPGTPVAYRAGDQPNTALSLNVLHPGDVAATGGTSGVIYGITDQAVFDPDSRVNGFAHVNHHPDHPRIGQLLCINGCGIQYAWIRQHVAGDQADYNKMEHEIARIPVGCDGLLIFPFGNGSERMFKDQLTGARMDNLQFNIHTRTHIYRAALEGIAFSFAYGMEILRTVGIKPESIRVGNDNLFLSQTFTKTMSNLLQCNIEMYNTTGSTGAAKASMVATGIFDSVEDAIADMKPVKTTFYEKDHIEYVLAYKLWRKKMKEVIDL